MPSLVTPQPCALCGALARDPVFEVTRARSEGSQTFRLVRCCFCELVMTEPQLSKPDLEAFYGQDYWGRMNPDDPAWVQRDQRHKTAFLNRFRRDGRVLDVGCGMGLFLLALNPARWDRYGLEAMPVPLAEAVKRLGPERIVQGELLTAGLPRGQFDVVTFWDVLEHLPNPRQALEETFRLLRPGGVVLLTLPNFSSYQARCFRQDWYALSLPHHLYHFTPQTLIRMLEGAGFRMLALADRFGGENYHAFKHSLLNQLTRRHGARGGRLRYYLRKPFLHPWEWLTTRLGAGSHLAAAATRPPSTR